jgi:alpha-ketoglutarate-dependent 2,4-dichlorophenoxyacetate dioxygenase
MLNTSPLHPRFGVEVHDLDLCKVTAGSRFDELRSAFEQHSLLLFRNQYLDQKSHFALAGLFGKIENREKDAWGLKPNAVSRVSNLSNDNKLLPESDRQLSHLKANQLWHTDSTFLPIPALANILAARVLPDSGGETEIASTRAAWKDMPSDLRLLTEDAILSHRYAHSRAQIDSDLAKQELFTMWPDQAWRAVWPNPVTGETALYIASHAFAVDGMDEEDGEKLIRQLLEFATQPDYVYCHNWAIGDVLIWDERATLHRGRPWPYNDERTLTSLCVTAAETDGLDAMRP